MSSIWHSRGYLPHCDGLSRQQFITYRLADSLPRAILDKLARECPSDEEESQRRARIDSFLDASHGSCLLERPECARIVEDNLLHFDGSRYRLLAWCVMPNHVHVLIDLIGQDSLEPIVHSWKSYSATHINRVLPESLRRARVWQREYWDRYIRDEQHLRTTIDYIQENPAKARLVKRAGDWELGVRGGCRVRRKARKSRGEKNKAGLPSRLAAGAPRGPTSRDRRRERHYAQ